MKKINIAFCVSSLEWVGPTNQLLYIIKNLEDAYVPMIITLSEEKSNTLIHLFEQEKIKIKCLNLTTIGTLLKGRKSIQQIVSSEGIEIVHGFGYRSDKLFSGINNVIYISTLRNYPYDDYPDKYGYWLGNYMAYSHLKAIKKITYPIACSKSIKNIFYKKHQKKIDFVQNGIDTERFDIADEQRMRLLKEELNIPKGKIIFFTAGDLIERKNTTTLIKAFNLSNTKSAHLIIAGDGFQKKMLSDQANHKNISFLGHTTRVGDYLKVSDCYLSSSLSEGLPNSVLEAMSCGLTPILSDIKPHKEVIQGLDAQLLFPANDPSSLHSKIEYVLKGDLIIPKKNIRNHILERFGARMMSKNYQKKYQQIIQEIKSSY